MDEDLAHLLLKVHKPNNITEVLILPSRLSIYFLLTKMEPLIMPSSLRVDSKRFVGFASSLLLITKNMILKN